MVISGAMADPQRVLHIAAPYIPVAACFLAFLHWNGSIVLGDKTMHIAVLHIPQIYYFVGFTSAMLLPYLVRDRIIRYTTSILFDSPQ